MYYVASKELTDLIVKDLRKYFSSPSYYGSVFNKDFSILGEPNRVNLENQPVYLISAAFPDLFRYYPNILVRSSVQQFHKLDNDNLIVQKDHINEYGKRDVDFYYKGGHLTLNINVTVRTLDQLECEQISDLIALWSVDYGWKSLKEKQAFINPFTFPGGVAVENLKDSTDQKKIYKVNLNTSIRVAWIVEEFVEAPILEKLSISYVENNLII